MNSLWSFVKTHLSAKTIVFLSSCRQVQFAHEAFCQLRPGVPLRCLHGKMKQMKRMAAFYDFSKAENMVLLATDVAARGLDFPTVDWVVQADCPEDVAAYIHRVGRTARYTASGRGLLLLAPSERAFVPLLEQAKIPIKEIHVNPQRQLPVTPALEGLLSRDGDLKVLAQKALQTYLKSVHMNANKAVFDLGKLPLEEYAASLGLAALPRLRFLTREQKRLRAAAGGGAGGSSDDDDEEEEDDGGDGDGGAAEERLRAGALAGTSKPKGAAAANGGGQRGARLWDSDEEARVAETREWGRASLWPPRPAVVLSD